MTGKIDLSKRYKTVGNMKVRILCTDRVGSVYSVVGLLMDGNIERTYAWTGDGRWLQDETSKYDLVEVSTYEGLQIDDVVATPGGAKAHFAGLAPDGRPRMWAEGRISHTAKASIDADVGRTTFPYVTTLNKETQS